MSKETLRQMPAAFTKGPREGGSVEDRCEAAKGLTDPAHIEAAMNDSPKVRAALVGNPNLTDVQRARLAEFTDRHIRSALRSYAAKRDDDAKEPAVRVSADGVTVPEGMLTMGDMDHDTRAAVRWGLVVAGTLRASGQVEASGRDVKYFDSEAVTRAVREHRALKDEAARAEAQRAEERKAAREAAKAAKVESRKAAAKARQSGEHTKASKERLQRLTDHGPHFEKAGGIWRVVVPADAQVGDCITVNKKDGERQVVRLTGVTNTAPGVKLATFESDRAATDRLRQDEKRERDAALRAQAGTQPVFRKVGGEWFVDVPEGTRVGDEVTVTTRDGKEKRVVITGIKGRDESNSIVRAQFKDWVDPAVQQRRAAEHEAQLRAVEERQSNMPATEAQMRMLRYLVRCEDDPSLFYAHERGELENLSMAQASRYISGYTGHG